MFVPYTHPGTEAELVNLRSRVVAGEPGETCVPMAGGSEDVLFMSYTAWRIAVETIGLAVV